MQLELKMLIHIFVVSNSEGYQEEAVALSISDRINIQINDDVFSDEAGRLLKWAKEKGFQYETHNIEVVISQQKVKWNNSFYF
jgi:hypothetical protein